MNHVNNVTYIRYAESARIGWARNYALHGSGGKEGFNGGRGKGEREKWMELWTPRGDGLILRRIECDFKFVRLFLSVPRSLILEDSKAWVWFACSIIANN